MNSFRLLQGDVLERLADLPDRSVQCCVTSPPYWGLRDYGTPGQIGLEPTPEVYVAKLVEVFREVRRVLRDDGTLWLNLGDSYAGSWKNQGRKEERGTQRAINGPMIQSFNGHPAPESNAGTVPPGLKPKDLVGIPWRVAFALQADGWYLRSDIIWSKPNPMPESVTDRPTKAHEYIFLLTKRARYYYDADAIREPLARAWDPGTNGGSWAHTQNQPIGTKAGHHSGEYPKPNLLGANCRTVWELATQPYPEAHFATFPEALAERCIKAGTSERGNCTACGAPYRRVTERGAADLEQQRRSGGVNGEYRGQAIKYYASANAQNPSDVKRRILDGMRERVTTSWVPACRCEADVRPAFVLDLFCGSGTTGQVALQLGRNFIGIDLNAQYLELARRRCSSVAPLFNQERDEPIEDSLDVRQESLYKD